MSEKKEKKKMKLWKKIVIGMVIVLVILLNRSVFYHPEYVQPAGY